MNIKEIIEKANKILIENNISESNLKVKLILSNILNVDKSYFIINFEKELSKDIENIFFNKINMLIENEPVQYIINNQEFYGYNFYVDKNVLIPQPDTEVLVEEIINLAKKQEKNLKILDLCTGSGAIAVSLYKNLENVEISASDISKPALEVANMNFQKNECKINLIESNLFENINDKFDIIVSNPPYIETEIIKTLSEEVKKEPFLALDGGEDGLDFYRKIIEDAKEYLNENGYLAFEIGYNQKDVVEKILRDGGYRNIYSRKDLSGNDRIVVGQI